MTKKASHNNAFMQLDPEWPSDGFQGSRNSYNLALLNRNVSGSKDPSKYSLCYEMSRLGRTWGKHAELMHISECLG